MDHEDEDDDLGWTPPLPPEDRIWRHPSELAASAPPAAATVAPDRPGATTARMVASGLLGAVMAVGAVALAGGFDERVAGTRVAAPVPADDDGPAGADPTAAVASATSPVVAGIEVPADDGVRTGSAVVLRSDGHLVTAAHLVRDATGPIEVRLGDGRVRTAEVVGADPETDVAVLHVEATDLVAASIGSAEGLTTGTWALAVGATAGDGPATTSCRVSATGRRLEVPGGGALHGMVLLDAPFAPGTTGGALVDRRGALVGLATEVPTTSAVSGRAFGVALPAEVASHVATQLIAHGHANRAWLGVHGADLDPAAAAAHDLPGAARVERVVAGSPAEAAGVARGDVVVAVDGVPIASMSELIASLWLHVPGDEAELEVLRDGVPRTVTVVLGGRDRS